jgi:hypothetical protein
MSTAAILRIACVAGEEETELVVAVGQRIADCLGPGYSVTLTSIARGEALPSNAIGLFSLGPDLASSREIAEVSASWHAHIARRAAAGERRLVIPTLFRHVRGGQTEARRERIRQLNLLAIELSRLHGPAVADVDQACALIGGDALASDYRCASPKAKEVFSFVVACAILGLDLGPPIPEDVRQAAFARLGSLNAIVRSALETAI